MMKAAQSANLRKIILGYSIAFFDCFISLIGAGILFFI